MQPIYELPAVATIYPTNHCYKVCKHCIFVQDKSLNSSYLDFNILKNTIVDLSKNKVLLVGIAGGDPLLYPDLLPLIKFIIANRMLPILTLSGAGITTSVISDLYSAGIRSVQLSLDSAQAEFHDFLRGQGSFNETIQSIQLLVKAGIVVSVAICVFSQNINEFKNILLLANKMHIRKVKIQRWKKNGSDSNANISEIDKEVFKELNSIYENEIKHLVANIQDVKFDLEALDSGSPKGIAILANGDLCLNEFQKPIGNINNQLPSEIMGSYNG